MTDPKDARNGVKTLGIRLPGDLHSQFALVAQLDNLSLSDAVLRAVEFYVEAKRTEPDFTARAAAALEEIEREAAARRAAIEGLFGAAPDPSVEQDVTPAKPATSRSRKASSEG